MHARGGAGPRVKNTDRGSAGTSSGTVVASTAPNNPSSVARTEGPAPIGFIGTSRPPLQPSRPNTASAGTIAPGACGLGKS